MSATKTAREKGKSDFLIDMSNLKTIEDFTMEQKGEVLTAISNYVLHDIELDKCEQSKAAVKKRWEQERNGQS